SDAGKRIVRPILIGGDAIIKAKDLADLFDRMWPSRVLRLNRVPGVFVMISGGAFLRPVNRLMQMPEPGGVDAGVILGAGSRKNKRRHQRQGTAKNAGEHDGGF